MGHNDCELNLSYPPVEVTEKNCTYACLLLNDYAGKNGELTALTQYFYQYLTSTMTKKQFKIFTSGSTRISLGIQNLRKLLVLIPLLEEQKQIAEILSTVDNKLENLKEKKQYFEELKKGLMQKLLTGEVRV